MLASRYTKDPRVRSDPENPTSAGLRYSELFSRLLERAISGDNVIYAIQSRFFASMFHCVDNMPHPVAQGLFAEALSRTLDGGLQRYISPTIMPNSISREIRAVRLFELSITNEQRTAWALYVWDKQISAFCGRPHLMHIWDMDVPIPEPFKDANGTLGTSGRIEDNDLVHVEPFRQLIQVSAVLESAFRASSHQPFVANSEFLNEVSRQHRPDDDDMERLDKTMASLVKWRSNAPTNITEPQPIVRSSLPGYSPATEQVALVDRMIQLLVASRHLQLETLSNDPRPSMLERYRALLITSSRELVALVVQLGSTSHLGHCDNCKTTSREQHANRSNGLPSAVHRPSPPRLCLIRPR
jgi:hypothetical protein